PSRSRFPRPRRLRRSRWCRAPGSRALRAPIAWIVLLIRALLRAACGRGREPEQPALGRNVRFRLLDLHADALARALRSRLHRERDVDPGHLLVVTVVDDGLVGHPVLDAPVDGADLEEVIGVEVDVGHIAVRTRDAQFVRLSAVDVLGAQVIDGTQAHKLRVTRPNGDVTYVRSEEHTSELQSLAYLVCRLL